MGGSGHLVAALRRADFRRLLGIRLAGQFGDGMFQASLAGAVLFNPDRQTNASAVAAGFAVLLLPYSVVGPFAGVLLDRWSRQRTLVIANLLRAAGVAAVAAELAGGLHGQPFYASALVIISVNRFILAALPAALPHVVEPTELVTSNAITTTTGGIATAVGGFAALLLRLPLQADAADAVAAVAAAGPYLLAALAAAGFARTALGPDDLTRARRDSARTVARGLLDGARHVIRRPTALRALGMITALRLCFGVTTVCTLLLYRNYFHSDGVFRAGLAGVGQVVVGLAIGSAAAAALTPAAARRLGYVRWPALLLAAAAVIELGLCLPYSVPLQLLAATGFGFVTQAVKICVDTVVQQAVEDDFRGRVFALYDTLFNVAFVAAATVAAIAIPESGHSPTSVVVLAVAYAMLCVAYARGGRPTFTS